MKVKNKENVRLVGSHSNTKSFWSKVIADSTSVIRNQSNKTSQSSQNHIESNYLDLVAQPTHKADDNEDSFSDPFQETVRRKLKLKEFVFLVNKYYPQQTASKILALANYHHTNGNFAFIEKALLFLQSENSFDNSVADMPNLEVPYPVGFDPNLLSPQVDKKVESQCTAEHRQAKANLMEIEKVLTPHCHPDYVKNVVKRLIQECNRTGDYGILDEALENRRNNVSRFYLR
jgi:hypothetical protein